MTQRDRDPELRAELARLDELLAGLWPGATGGDPASVGAALRVMERRAKYLGLDARPASTSSPSTTDGNPIDDLTGRRAARRSAPAS